MRGTWGGERLRRKGRFRARIEALLAVWGQAARGGEARRQTPGPLGVKEPAFLELRLTPNRGRNRLRGCATNDTPHSLRPQTARRAWENTRVRTMDRLPRGKNHSPACTICGYIAASRTRLLSVTDKIRFWGEGCYLTERFKRETELRIAEFFGTPPRLVKQAVKPTVPRNPGSI